jgi:hypothetical protein
MYSSFTRPHPPRPIPGVMLGTIVFIHLGLVPAFSAPDWAASLYIAPRIG